MREFVQIISHAFMRLFSASTRLICVCTFFPLHRHHHHDHLSCLGDCVHTNHTNNGNDDDHDDDEEELKKKNGEKNSNRCNAQSTQIKFDDFMCMRNGKFFSTLTLKPIHMQLRSNCGNSATFKYVL